MNETTLSNYDEQKIADLFVGRKVVHAEMRGDYRDAVDSFYNTPEGLLILDDGTKLYLTGNDGGCACSAGCYPLESVATVENIITNAWVVSKPNDDYDGGEGVYQIFVLADNEQVNVAEFQGSDGNGYYGTGFALTVVREK